MPGGRRACPRSRHSPYPRTSLRAPMKRTQQINERIRFFAKALVNNQRADDYTLLTVLAALILFFADVAGRLYNMRTQWAALAIGTVLFIVAAVIVATFPVII